ncbi:MAG: hypothetical protein ABIO36_02440 [Pyrinomonadaceae bacterium]
MKANFNKQIGLASLARGLSATAFVFAVFWGVRMWQDSRQAALDSCKASVQSAVANTLNINKFKETILLNQNWRELDAKEQKIVFDFLSTLTSFDCSPFPPFNNADSPDGNDLRIFARKVDSRVDVKIGD